MENESEAVYQKSGQPSLIAHFAFIAGNYAGIVLPQRGLPFTFPSQASSKS